MSAWIIIAFVIVAFGCYILGRATAPITTITQTKVKYVYPEEDYGDSLLDDDWDDIFEDDFDDFFDDFEDDLDLELEDIDDFDDFDLDIQNSGGIYFTTPDSTDLSTSNFTLTIHTDMPDLKPSFRFKRDWMGTIPPYEREQALEDWYKEQEELFSEEDEEQRVFGKVS